MYSKLRKEIIDNIKYIFCAVIIVFMSLLPQLFATLADVGISKHFIFLIIVLIFTVLLANISKVIFSFFVIYLNITSVLIGHIYFHWGYANASITARINTASVSPLYEIIEYLKTYIDIRDILLIIYALIVMYLLYRCVLYLKYKFKLIKILSLTITMTILLAMGLYRNPLTSAEPFNIYYKWYNAKHTGSLYTLRKKYLTSHKYENKIQNSGIYDQIIILQGESVNKYHMSCYGYHRATTPFLDKLKKSKSIYLFNVIAPTNQTRYSIPIIYTNANVHNFRNKFLHSLSILSYYQHFGYRTYWISNQGATDLTLLSIAEEANQYFFTGIDYISAKYDNVLLKHIIEDKNNFNGRKLYVFHLIGSHFRYIDRYPLQSALISPIKSIIDEYDNTIYYTDIFIKEIFKYFLSKNQKKKTLIIYLSDHGEVIEKSLQGHGFNPPYKDEYVPPFIIYSSIKNPRLDTLILKNKKHYFNLENFSGVLDYINGISKDLNISYSGDVIAVDSKNILNYNNMDFYNNLNKRK